MSSTVHYIRGPQNPIDRLGRPLHDLRISVMDRCNFRCPYCMPKEQFHEHYRFLKSQERLSFEEIVRLARLFASLGVRKLRLTGGEPLLRTNLADLVGDLPDVPGIAAGLTPVKINAVIERGLNDHTALDLVERFRGSPVIVRFIEFMDVGNRNNWRPELVVPSRELAARIHERWPIQPISENYRGEVAQRWRFEDGAGEVGFISSVSQPFCGACSRARLSSEGKFYTCLFATQGLDLRAPLRAGASDADLLQLIRGAWNGRTDRYSELREEMRRSEPQPKKIEM